MYPCDVYSPPTPALYAYYAVVSLTVVILAVSLLWIPVVHLIAEMNIIIARVLIYTHKEILGNNDICFFNKVENLFVCSQTLVIISGCFISYIMYLASTNFLIFAGCFICNLPNHKYLLHLKIVGLRVIQYLLNLTGKNSVSSTNNGKIAINYHDHHQMD